MTKKVKRGLGLLVVASMALGIGLFAQLGRGEYLTLEWLAVGASLTMVASAAGGLCLIAWGLLRD